MNAPVIAKIKSQRSEPKNTPVEVRAAYCYFHEKRTKNSAGVPYTKKDGTPSPRYSATLMFPKLSNDPTQCPNYAWLYSLAVEAAKKMWPTNVDHATGNWVWPQGAQYPVKDGDVPFVPKPKPGVPAPSPEETARKNAWRRGYWIVEVENFLDPGPSIAIVQNGQVVPIPAKVINGIEQYKSGDFGIANIHAYAYQNETFGVDYGFDGFLFTRPGEPIGSSGPRSAEQMFGGVAVPAAPAASPPQPGPATYAPSPPLAPAAPAAPVYAPPPAAPAPAMAYAPPPGAPPAAPQPPAAPPMPPAAPAAPPMPPGVPGGLPPFPAPR